MNHHLEDNFSHFTVKKIQQFLNRQLLDVNLLRGRILSQPPLALKINKILFWRMVIFGFLRSVQSPHPRRPPPPPTPVSPNIPQLDTIIIIILFPFLRWAGLWISLIPTWKNKSTYCTTSYSKTFPLFHCQRLNYVSCWKKNFCYLSDPGTNWNPYRYWCKICPLRYLAGFTSRK